MARLPRVTQKIFAQSALNNGVFGSAQANAGPGTISNDLPTIMGLAAWLDGWLEATIGASKFPPLEEFQALNYVNTTQLAYLFQQGIAEYDSGTTYFTNNIVAKAGTYQLYGSKTNGNVGNALTDTVNWQLLLDLSSASGNAIFTGGTSTGSANAHVVTPLSPSSGFSLSTNGATVIFTAGFTNTGAMTLNAGGTGATSCKINSGAGLINPPAGAVVAGDTIYATVNTASGVYVLTEGLPPSSFLQAANNLSDLGSLSTALANLGFLQSIGASGYLKLPGGIIIQWGSTGVINVGATANVTFPLTFPTACRSLVTAVSSAGAAYSQDQQALSASGFTLGNPSASGNNVNSFYIALGN